MNIIKTRLSTKFESGLSLSPQDKENLDHALACFGFILPMGSHSLVEFVNMIDNFSNSNKAKALVLSLKAITKGHSTQSAKFR